MTDKALPPLGRLLEAGRHGLALSIREAARRAGISEGRWRQVVNGVQLTGGVEVPVRPKLRTLVAMALAVDVDPHVATQAVADIPYDSAQVRQVANELRPAGASANSGGLRATATQDQLAEELERIGAMDHLPAATRYRMIRALLAVAEEVAAEQQHEASQEPRRAAG